MASIALPVSTPAYPPGWYRVRLLADAADAPLRGEVVFRTPPEGGALPVAREPFALRDRRASLLVHLPARCGRVAVEWAAGAGRPAVTVDLWPVGRAEWLARSAWRKFRIVREFGCLGPVLRRGAWLFVTGRWGEVRTKLKRGVADSSTWDLGRAAAPQEAAAAWHGPPGTSGESGRIRHPARLHLAGDLTGLTGYDHVVHALLAHLPAAGLPVEPHPNSRVRPDLLPPGVPMEPTRRAGDLPRLIVAPPFQVADYRPTGRDAVLTMWETGQLRPEWVRALNAAGRVIVPSRWGERTFRAAGVRAPITVVPLGHDPGVFAPASAPDPRKPCVFGTAGAVVAGGVRKNVSGAVELFRRAFPENPGVRLRVKLTPASLALETYNDSRIEVCRDFLPPRALAAWVASLDAYLNLSAGEGFGLHLLEAMACGRPLITTNYSGLTEFFAPECGYVVPHALTPADGRVYQGVWAEPDAAAVISTLRAVAAERPEAARRGRLAARRAAALTWAATAEGVAAAVGGIGSADG